MCFCSRFQIYQFLFHFFLNKQFQNWNCPSIPELNWTYVCFIQELYFPSLYHVIFLAIFHQAEIVFPFSKYFGQSAVSRLVEMREEIMNLSFVGEKTNITGALKLMRRDVLNPNNGDRPDVKVGKWVTVNPGH